MADLAHGQMFCAACREKAPPQMQYLAKLYGVAQHRRRRRQILDELSALYRHDIDTSIKAMEGQYFLRGNGFVAKLVPHISAILLRDVSAPHWLYLSRREREQIWGPEKHEFEL